MHGRKGRKKMKGGTGDLFEEKALTRSTDPDTSHMAAERVDVQKSEKPVLDCLLANYPLAMTAVEISLAIKVDKWTVSPRLKPLEEKGKVERYGKKVAINSNGRTSQQIAWRAKL